MDKFIQRAMTEHKDLIEKIDRLSTLLDTTSKDNQISKQEYSLMYHQFELMNDYAATLESRLNMHGIEIDGGRYYEDVTKFTATCPFTGTLHDNKNQTDKDANK